MITDETPDWSFIDFGRKLSGILQTEAVDGFNFAERTPDSGALASVPISSTTQNRKPSRWSFQHDRQLIELAAASNLVGTTKRPQKGIPARRSA